MLNLSNEGAQFERRYCSIPPAMGAHLVRYIHRLLPQIEDWQKRPLNEVYSIIFIDAVHFSVRCR